MTWLGRQPEENISSARTVFILLISNGEKILNNVNVAVWGQVKRENIYITSGGCSRLKSTRA